MTAEVGAAALEAVAPAAAFEGAVGGSFDVILRQLQLAVAPAAAFCDMNGALATGSLW